MHTFTVLSTYWYPHDLLVVVNGCKVNFRSYLNASSFHDVDWKKKWMMEEERTKVRSTGSIRILFSSLQNCIIFVTTRLLLFPLSIYKKIVLNACFSSPFPWSQGIFFASFWFGFIILFLIAFDLSVVFRTISSLGSLGGPWVVPQWSKSKWQKITHFRRRTNEQSPPRIILLCLVSLELFFFSVFHVLTEPPWRKLNSAPVCFGARDNQFGRFQVEVGGSIQAVKLVHLSGQVSCDRLENVWSKRGCDGNTNIIIVFLTDASNTVLLPMGQNSRYTIPGYDAQSSEIVFSVFPTPLHLSSKMN